MTARSADGAAPGTAVQLARLLQFGDSMFPVGGFSFSGGLESAIQKGLVHDVETLGDYARTSVEQSVLGDGIALLCAHRAAAAGDLEELAHIDQQVHARKLSAETRTMSVRMGKKLAEMGAAIIDAPLPRSWLERIKQGATPGCYPVALATLFAAQGLPDRDAFVIHQYGVGAMVLGAALRLMKVSHVDTQRLLFELNESAEAAYADASRAELSDMASFAPQVDILAAVHVKAHVRLFMN